MPRAAFPKNSKRTVASDFIPDATVIEDRYRLIPGRAAGVGSLICEAEPLGWSLPTTKACFTELAWCAVSECACLTLTLSWVFFLAAVTGLVGVEKIGLPPRGIAGTKIPLCTAPTRMPPTPPLAALAVPMIVCGANTLLWNA